MQEKAYEVSRDEDAYGNSQQLHLKHVYTNFPEDDPIHAFILTVPGIRQPALFPAGKGREAPEPRVLEVHLSTIKEVLDVLGRYFEDADAPASWTEEYLRTNKDTRLQLLQAQETLQEVEARLHASEDHVQYYGEKAAEAKKRIAQLQAEIEARHAD